MSGNKRQKQSHAGPAPAAVAASRAAAAAVPSGRQVLGRRAAPAAAAAAAGPAASPPPIDLGNGADEEEEDAWSYPEHADLMAAYATKAVAYSYKLTPDSGSVFGKYKQAGLDSIVGEVMKFILMRTSAGLVVHHREILDVLQERCKNGAHFIIEDARRRFMELYGYELHEVARTEVKKGSASAPSTSTRTYILRAPVFKLPGLQRAYSCAPSDAKADDSRAVQSLLFWIFAVIHAEESSQSSSEGPEQPKGCPESKLWRVMRPLGIDRDMKHHEVFGNIANLVDDFVKQGYLVKVKLAVDPAAEPSSHKSDLFAYRIGARGQAEMSTKALYHGMCSQVFGVPPNQAHIKQIERNEQLATGRPPKNTSSSAAHAAPSASQRA